MNKIHSGKEAETQQTKWRKEKALLPGQYGTQNGVMKEYILPSDEWLHGTWEDAPLTRSDSLCENI
jgi:hypothetical protein